MSTAGRGERGDRPAPGDVFDVLSNRRRRYALHHLKRHADEPVSLSDLSKRVAAWEQRTEPEGLTYEDRKSVHTSLSQFHVPKMRDAGLVRFDPGDGVVELTEAGSDLDVYLETVRGDELPWSSYFVLLSVFSGALVSGAAVGVPVFVDAPLGVGAFVVVAFLVSSLAFRYDSRYRMRVGGDGPPPEYE